MQQNISVIDPEQLSFDYKNPRIAEFNITEKTPEREVIKILWDAMGVEEIVLSIKASGFFSHEPLIAISKNGVTTVIEGNRRLAAVKCILKPELADFIGINKNSLKISDQGILKTLRQIPVIVVDSRKDAWKFIGFKHINGAAKWGSYAKAQYISQIKNEFGISLEEIALQIGDTNKTVEKLYQGLQVIEQAEKLHIFDRTDISANRLFFSHLYTALAYEGYRNYLGIKDSSSQLSNPVSEDKTENLEQLLLWIYGSKKGQQEPVIQSQNPDLRHLESVLKSKEATFALKDGISLIQAYEISRPKTETFEQSLLEAKRALQKAQSYRSEAFDGKDEGLLRQAGTIADIADDLYQGMVKKWQSLQPNSEKSKRMSTGE